MIRNTASRIRNSQREETDKVSNFSLHPEPRTSILGKDANGVSISFPGIGQGMHLLFDYCPRIYDDNANIIQFPKTVLRLVPSVTGPKVTFDYDTFKRDDVPTIDGGKVSFHPFGDGRVMLHRHGPSAWDRRASSFGNDGVELVNFSKIEPDSEFDAVLEAPLNSNMRFQGQSESPDAKEALKLAMDALKVRCGSDGNMVTLKSERHRIVRMQYPSSPASGDEQE